MTRHELNTYRKTHKKSDSNTTSKATHEALAMLKEDQRHVEALLAEYVLSETA